MLTMLKVKLISPLPRLDVCNKSDEDLLGEPTNVANIPVKVDVQYNHNYILL